MSIGSALKSVGKFLTTPVEWATSPVGWLLDAGLNFLGQYNANQANIDLWKMQADYNKPINQLARLREAGLNPNLIYGSGGVQNTITSAPKMEGYKFSFPDGVMAYQQILNGEKQRELLQAQIDNERKKTPVLIETATSKKLDNEYKQYENDYYKKTGTIKGGNPIVKGVSQLYYWAEKNGAFGDSQARDVDLASKYYEDRSNIVAQETEGDYHYYIYSNGVRVPVMRRVEKGVWKPIRIEYR